MGLKSGVITVPKKSRKPKVKIVPPHLWPPCFPAPGVYDIQQDKIYVKGGLSNTSYRQILKHENAHRQWYLNNQLIRKLIILLFGNHALYYIISISATIVFLCSAILGLENLTILLGVISIALYYTHFIMFHIVLEIPAWIAAGSLIKVASVKETLQSVVMELLTIVTPFLLAVWGLWLFGAITTLIFLGLGLLISWIFPIYFSIGALAILRKSGSQRG